MRKNLRHWLIGLAVLALSILIFLNRNDIVSSVRLIQDANWQLLLLIPLIQTTSFFAKANYYRVFLHSFKYHLPFRKLFELTFAVNFINQISPAAGVTGASFFTYQLRPKIPSGKTTLIEYGRYILAHLSYVILIAIAVLLVFLGGDLNGVVLRILLSVVTVGLILNIGFIALMAHKRLATRLVHGAQKLIDRIVMRFRPGKPILIGPERAQRLLDEFHDGYDFVVKERRHLVAPFMYALLSNVMEVTTLTLIFVALGADINVGKIIIAYAVANTAGAVSLIPGDVGVYEVALVATLSGIGLTVPVALSATLLYRVVNKAISLPIGFYCYSRLIKSPLRSHAVSLEKA